LIHSISQSGKEPLTKKASKPPSRKKAIVIISSDEDSSESDDDQHNQPIKTEIEKEAECPVCKLMVNASRINSHLDICLGKSGKTRQNFFEVNRGKFVTLE
jgi:hypothetical protein